jgi:uncharacterized protein YpiB (UPF0302 family)
LEKLIASLFRVRELNAALEQYGLKNKIHSWMISYLNGRTEFVEVQHADEKTSSTKIYSLSCKEIKYVYLRVLFWDPFSSCCY